MSSKTMKTKAELKKAQQSKSASLGTLIKIKGFADILTGVVIAAKPALLYESPPVRWWHEVSGFVRPFLSYVLRDRMTDWRLFLITIM